MGKLKDIAKVQSGVYIKTSPSPDVIYLQLNDFDSIGNINDVVRPTVIIDSTGCKHLLEDGDLLFAAKTTKNFSVLWDTERGKAIASSSFLVVRLKDRENILPEYVNWYLNLPTTLQPLSATAAGTSIPSITKAMLEDVNIYIPDLSTQKVITSIVRLQEAEQRLYSEIARKHQQITDYKLKNVISNG